MVQKRKRNRTGAAAVEAGLMLPLLVLLTFGSIDVAQYINTAQVVSNSCREGARIASRSSTESTQDVKDTVLEYMANVFPQLSDDELEESIAVHTRKATQSGNENNISSGNLNSIESGDTILVSVTFDFGQIRWLHFVPGFNSLSTSTYCRRE